MPATAVNPSNTRIALILFMFLPAEAMIFTATTRGESLLS